MGRLIVPFFYFLDTRLNNIKAWVFHSYYEWIPNILLLYFFVYQNQLYNSLVKFTCGYLAFISIYEIGYLMNDHYATKFDNNPRKRSVKLDVNVSFTILFIAVRLVMFYLCTRYVDALYSIKWYSFYTMLIAAFMMHNLVKVKGFKVLTFINLATFRFFAPIFIFVSIEDLKTVFLPVFLCYVLFRTFIYMDSKGLLAMPEQTSSKFKLAFYLLLFPLHIWLSIILDSNWPFYIISYYTIFSLTYYLIPQKFKRVITH